MSDMSFKKQLPANVLSNIAYFALTVVVGIWLVPYFIRHLGLDGYGFIPLATSVTNYVSLITVSLSGATLRYLVIDLQRKDVAAANKIFNTAFWSTSALSLLLLPLFAAVAFFSPSIFHVPSHLSMNVQWLFLFISLSFVASVFSSVFAVSTAANNRLDLQNAVYSGNICIRTILVLFFFALFSSCLFFVGLAYLLGALAALYLGYRFFKKLTPELSICWADFDPSRLKELTGMGGWLVINQIGSLLFLQIDLIVANLLLGAEQAGRYGAVLQWSILLRSLAGVFSTVLTPIVMISYAREETARIVMMSQRAVKFMGMGVGLLTGLLCGFAEPLLTIWLGKDFSSSAPLLIVLIAHLTINLAVLPLFSINTALNRVKLPGWVTLVMGMGNLFLAIFLSKFCGWGLYGIAGAGAIVLTIKNAFFTPFYAAHILGLPLLTFIKPIGRGVLLAGFAMLAGRILTQIFVMNTWMQFVLPAGIGFLVCLLVGVVLLGKDREFIFSLTMPR